MITKATAILLLTEILLNKKDVVYKNDILIKNKSAQEEQKIIFPFDRLFVFGRL